MAVVKVEVHTSKKGDGIQQTTAELGKLDKGISATTLGFGKMGTSLATMAGGVLSLAATFKFVSSSLDAYGEAEENVNKLNLALANQGNFTQEASAGLQALASSLQDTTKFADDTVIAMEAALASFGLAPSVIAEATKAAADFAAATGTDAVTAAEMLGKASTGNVTALQKLGFQFDQGATDAQKFQSALDQVNQRFGGAAAASAAGYAGQLVQLQNVFGDVQEAVGKFVVELLNMGPAVGGAVGFLKSVRDFIAVDLVIALSEARARFAEMVAFFFEMGAKANDAMAAVTFGDTSQGFKDMASAMRLAAQDQQQLAGQLRDAGDAAAQSSGSIVQVTNATKVHAQVSDEAAKAAAKYAEEVSKLAQSLGTGGLAREAGLMGAAVEKIGGLANVSAEGFKRLQEEVKKLQQNAMAIPAALQPVATLMEIMAKNKPTMKPMQDAWKGMAMPSPFEVLGGQGRMDALRKPMQAAKEETFGWQGALQGVALLAGTLGGTLGNVLDVVGNIGQAFANAKTDADKFNAIASGVGQIGGMIGGKKGGVLQGAAGGAMAGFAVGGPIGAAIGGIAGGIMGFFKKKKEEMVKESQEAAKGIAEAIAGGMDVTPFIPKLLKDKKTALAVFDDLGKQFAQMQAEYKAKVLDLTKAGVGGLTAMIDHLGSKTDATQADFDRMGSYVMGLFGSLRAQGLSFVDAVAQMKPALDALRKKSEDKGEPLTGGAAELVAFSGLVEQNQELVAAAEGAAQVLQGLRASGSLTQETFIGLQTDVMGYVTELEASGFTAAQALAVAAPSLYQLKKAHDDLGLSLDAQTQAAVDAAQAQGLFEGMSDPMEEMKKAMDAMVQVLAAIAHEFGAVLPAAVQQYIASLNQIPKDIPVPGGGAPADATGAPGGGAALPGHAGGLDYVPRGPLPGGGSQRILHEGEAVLDKADARAWRGGGGDNVNVRSTIVVPPWMNEQQAEDMVVRAQLRALRDNRRGLTTRTRKALSTRG